jgi:hypothetical protein
MKRSKFSEEQVAYALRQVEAGTPVGDVCRQLGVSEATFNVKPSESLVPNCLPAGEAYDDTICRTPRE